MPALTFTVTVWGASPQTFANRTEAYAGTSRAAARIEFLRRAQEFQRDRAACVLMSMHDPVRHAPGCGTTLAHKSAQSDEIVLTPGAFGGAV
jgi:hypothetical protein